MEITLFNLVLTLLGIMQCRDTNTHFLDIAVLCKTYYKVISDDNPMLHLLNIGTESNKGTPPDPPVPPLAPVTARVRGRYLPGGVRLWKSEYLAESHSEGGCWFRATSGR